MAWGQELQALEDALRSLNAQYDAFLYGSSPKPPVEIRRKVGAQIRRLSTSEPDNSAERYRFSTLQGRYNALCERWDRLQAEKEAGKRPGVYGHFTRISGAGLERPPSRPNAPPASSVERDGGKPAASAESSAERDLFERFRKAKLEHGEDVRGLDFEKFVQRLALERAKLAQHFGVQEIEFDIAERDGRVRLVARPKETTT
ncbi:MAG TPA: MXAN_5187 C-terminal domain-containing protein [Thermoanaerobaculia bacterium]|nr:MXAN_5187 C-terminal domain-containing protein [Thermoanaerobaculia bacterium]